jgi:predicted amidohydrolase
VNATLRVAAAQGESVPGDVRANVATAVALVEEAAERGARLVVLPELFLTGYAPEVWGVGQAITPDDERLVPLRIAGADRRVVVVVGAAVRREPQVATLSLLVVDDRGEVSAPYDKQHLFGVEPRFFRPGDHGASILVDGWELGLGICNDGCFPEHAAAAARDGARAYLCPSAYYVGSEHRRDLYYAARALDNGLYVVFAGLSGRCGERDFSGGSVVYDPEGRALDRVDEPEGIAVADLDAAEVARVREMNPIGPEAPFELGSRTRHVLGTR